MSEQIFQRCAHCTWWRRWPKSLKTRYGITTDTGECTLMEVNAAGLLVHTESLLFAVPDRNTGVGVTTDADFGCVQFAPR